MSSLELRRVLGVLLCLAWVLAAEGGSPLAAAEPVAKTYQPGELFLDTSRVVVHVGKVGFGHEHAVLGGLRSGAIRLGAGENAGRLVFDLATFTADTDDARKYLGLKGSTDADTQREVVANMLGPAVLDVKQFPTAEFVAQSVQLLPERSKRNLPQYQFDGAFTLHGVTQPLRFQADVEEQNGWLHVRGGFRIRQTSYGITPFSKAFGAVGVADELTIWGDLWIAK